MNKIKASVLSFSGDLSANNGTFSGKITASGSGSGSICIGSTCISEDNLKMLIGKKSYEFYYRR